VWAGRRGLVAVGVGVAAVRAVGMVREAARAGACLVLVSMGVTAAVARSGAEGRLRERAGACSPASTDTGPPNRTPGTRFPGVGCISSGFPLCGLGRV
jgi:hypothetical protein